MVRMNARTWSKWERVLLVLSVVATVCTIAAYLFGGLAWLANEIDRADSPTAQPAPATTIELLGRLDLQIQRMEEALQAGRVWPTSSNVENLTLAKDARDSADQALAEGREHDARELIVKGHMHLASIETPPGKGGSASAGTLILPILALGLAILHWRRQR